MLEEVPHRVVADLDAARRKLRYQRPQRHIRLIGEALQQPVPLAGQCIGPVATHRAGCRATGGARTLRPLHREAQEQALLATHLLRIVEARKP